MTQTPNPPEYDRTAPYPEIDRVPPPPVPPSPGTVLVELPKTRPIVTYTLLAVTIFIYILQEAGQALYGVDLVTGWGLKVNEMILQGQFWRLITPMFLHGSILHIAFNMYALLAIGPGLERYFGHTRFLALYFISGFAGNVASFMFSTAPSLGSSTAIFGLLGAEGVFLYRNQRILGGSARRALNNIIMIAVINLLIGLSPGIDNWGHLGGLIGGTLFAWFAGPVLSLEGVYPTMSLVDSRETREVVLAGLIDVMVFALLAFGTVYLRGN